MIEKTAHSVTYRGGDGQSIFPIPFPFLDPGHIGARIGGGDGKWRSLAAGADYTINALPDGEGDLILAAGPLPAEQTLEITRTVPLTQEILFHNQGPNSPRAMEEAVDKLTMIAQQQRADNASIAAGLAGGFDGAIDGMRRAIAGKAEKNHSHAASAVTDLSAILAAKADTQALAGKAALRHSHAASDVDGLAGALAGKASAGHRHAAADIDGIASAPESQTGDHARLINRDADNQHPQSAIQDLAQDLASINAGLENLMDALATAQTALAAKADKSELPGTATQSENGLMSAGDKRKLDDLSPGGGAAAVMGKIELWPFRPDDLPPGWHFANGAVHGTATAVGQALASLPPQYRSDWGIVSSGGYINLPDLCNNGGGYFLRPVDGISRQPGSVQTDAIRNLTGQTGGACYGDRAPVSGVFQRAGGTVTGPGTGSGTYTTYAMDASLSVPTAPENRPVNIGMTPAIYLGA